MLFREAQSVCITIPGHAEYYRDLILKARLDYEEAKAKADPDSDRPSFLRSQLSGVQDEGFRTLAYLPSVETVRVLGEFLTDRRGYTELGPIPTMRALEIAGLEKPNCLCAAKAFVCLPIVGKPLEKNWTTVNIEDVNPWLTWYEQIKAGNRTFRFEGDPTEYDLNGPATKEAIQRAQLNMKRDEERATGHKKAVPTAEATSKTTPAKNPSTIVGVLAACVLVAGAVWYFMMRRNASLG